MILIVDDDPDTGAALERLLRYAGQEAVHVMNGSEALQLLAVRRPSLVLLDLMMPDIYGIEVLRTIRATPNVADVPVVVYSADAQHSTMVKAQAAGATDFVVKGTISWASLVKRIVELAGSAEPPP
jgi:CheY-like chemotaxis protein